MPQEDSGHGCAASVYLHPLRSQPLVDQPATTHRPSLVASLGPKVCLQKRGDTRRANRVRAVGERGQRAANQWAARRCSPPQFGNTRGSLPCFGCLGAGDPGPAALDRGLSAALEEAKSAARSPTDARRSTPVGCAVACVDADLRIALCTCVPCQNPCNAAPSAHFPPRLLCPDCGCCCSLIKAAAPTPASTPPLPASLPVCSPNGRSSPSSNLPPRGEWHRLEFVVALRRRERALLCCFASG